MHSAPREFTIDEMPKLVHGFNCCLLIVDNQCTVHHVWEKCICQHGPYYLRKALRSPLLCALKPFSGRMHLNLYNLILCILPGTAIMLFASFSLTHTTLNRVVNHVLSSAQTTLCILPSPRTQIPPTFHDGNLFPGDSFLSLKS